jgi:hypothetical protein
MSKLNDLIRRALRAEPAPIGFGAGAQKPAPTMLLAALAGDHWSRAAAEAIAAGADALVLAGRPGDKELAEAIGAADGKPCGLIAADATADQLAKLRAAGLDFAVLDLQTPSAALQEEELGMVLRVRDDLTDFQLRAIDSLSVDALYLERETGASTIARQLDLLRVSGLARKPLLVAVRGDAQQPDLLSLRDAGVVAVAVDLGERGAAGALRRLRGVIDGLPRRKPRKRGEGEVSLVRLGAPPPPPRDDEDEDDED